MNATPQDKDPAQQAMAAEPLFDQPGRSRPALRDEHGTGEAQDRAEVRLPFPCHSTPRSGR